MDKPSVEIPEGAAPTDLVCEDLEVGTGAEALEEPAAAFAQDLAAALADDSDLTQEERSARNGLANRQVTLR